MAVNKTMTEAAEILAAEEEEEKVTQNRRATIGLVLAFAILFFFHWVQPIAGLKPQAQTVVGIFAWFITVMVTDAMNKLVVGLTTPLLLVVLGGYKVPEGFKAFSSGGLQYASQIAPPAPPKPGDDPVAAAEALDRWAKQQANAMSPKWIVRVDPTAKAACPT